MNNCTISGNSNSNAGPGVWNRNSIDLSGCTISNNDGAVGGGLENEGTATVTNCTIDQNTVYLNGGGISNGWASYVADNVVAAVLDMTGSTISANNVSGGGDATGGGGLSNYGEATLADSTIANNIANDGSFATRLQRWRNHRHRNADACGLHDQRQHDDASGGGIYVGGPGANAVTLNNTIVAGNTSQPQRRNPTASDIVAANGASVFGSNNLIGTGGSAGSDAASPTSSMSPIPDLGPSPITADRPKRWPFCPPVPPSKAASYRSRSALAACR